MAVIGNLPPIKEVKLPDGSIRYRFVIDMPKGSDGKRVQKTRTYASLAMAEEDRMRLVEARDSWRRPTEEQPVTDLFKLGLCHPKCVFAWETEDGICLCACQGKYHGRLSDLRADWVLLEHAPVRNRRRIRKPLAVGPVVRARIAELLEEARKLPAYQHRPATYIRERLAESGVKLKQVQVNGQIEYLRKLARKGAA